MRKLGNAIQNLYGQLSITAPNPGGNALTVTGNIVVNAPPAGVAMSVAGKASSYAMGISSVTGAGTSLGLSISAGTNASDTALHIANAAQSASFLDINGLGSVTLYGTTSGANPSLTVIGTDTAPLLHINSSTVAMEAQTSGSNGYLGTSNSTTFNLMANNIARIAVASTGNVAIQPPTSVVDALTVTNNQNGVYAATFISTASGSNNRGLRIQAGTNTSDYNLVCANSANTVNYFLVHGDGGVSTGSSVSGSQGVGTISAAGFFVNTTPVYKGGAQITAQSGGVASGGANGDIILIY